MKREFSRSFYLLSLKVYEQTTQSLIPPILSGYNATVFAYGATGSGKTFTMIGTHDVGGGVMVLAMRDLFDAIHCQTHRLAEEREGDMSARPVPRLARVPSILLSP
ncbi:MAG: hypothetical protein J0L85_17215 [Zoogloea sp.]|nr:hypothetical protein [Zoogloea sp.]